jgi:dimethyl sulfoxide reductase iron-sulfur subunit
MAGRSISRRNVLKMLGLLGAGSAAGWVGLNSWPLTTLAEDRPAAPGEAGAAEAHQWFYLIDLRRCDGCNGCTEACQKMHYLPEEQTWIKVYEMEGAGGQKYFMPRLCMHCENAPCVQVCPVKASYKSPEGLTLIDQNRCIGCRMCMAACPYEARYFNWGEPAKVPAGVGPNRPEYPVPQQKGTVGKCVMCVHNLHFGKLPACLEACTMGALYVGDYNTDLATNGQESIKLSEFLKEQQVVRFKEELNTRPRVYYVLGHGEKLEY